MNRLYFGGNLEWLRDRREFPDASVDLVYLDLPFNSRMRIRKCTPARRSQSHCRVRQLINQETPVGLVLICFLEQEKAMRRHETKRRRSRSWRRSAAPRVIIRERLANEIVDLNF
jgi:hypothetical protein